jgi:hypothetical protein
LGGKSLSGIPNSKLGFQNPPNFSLLRPFCPKKASELPGRLNHLFPLGIIHPRLQELLSHCPYPGISKARYSESLKKLNGEIPGPSYSKRLSYSK